VGAKKKTSVGLSVFTVFHDVPALSVSYYSSEILSVLTADDLPGRGQLSKPPLLEEHVQKYTQRA
jgi:hypothetical protein